MNAVSHRRGGVEASSKMSFWCWLSLPAGLKAIRYQSIYNLTVTLGKAVRHGCARRSRAYTALIVRQPFVPQYRCRLCGATSSGELRRNQHSMAHRRAFSFNCQRRRTHARTIYNDALTQCLGFWRISPVSALLNAPLTFRAPGAGAEAALLGIRLLMRLPSGYSFS